MKSKKILDHQKDKKIKLRPGQEKGASLVEVGVLLGLMAVSAIGAIYATGEEVETAFCIAANGVADGMERDRPLSDCDQTPGGSFVPGTVTPPPAPPPTPPVNPQPPGWTNGDFTDMHYNLGTTGVQRVMMPFQTNESSLSFRASISSSNTYSDGTISACYMTNDAILTCRPRASSSSISLPDDATHIGYELTLPVEDWKPWTNEVNLRILNSASDPQWPITVDREQAAPLFNPTFGFANMVFEEGTTGDQIVMVEKTGAFEGPLRYFLETVGGRNGVGPCVQDTESSQPRCFSHSYTNIQVDADTYAIGYNLTLPNDPYIPYDRSQIAEMTSEIWLDHFADWTYTITRPAKPIALAPSFAMTDKVFAQSTTGRQTVMFPMDGNFAGDMYLRYRRPAGSPSFGLCIQATPSSSPSCNVRNYKSGSMTVPEDTYAIGYALNLSTNVMLDQLVDLEMTLESKYDSNLSTVWDFDVTRPAVPPVVQPSFTMSDKIFPQGTTGIQTVMFPMTGNFTGNMTLQYSRTPKSPSYGLCIQATSSSSPSCTRRGYSVGSLSVPEDTYAIGYSISLSTNDKIDQQIAVDMTLKSQFDNEEKAEWSFNVSRPKIPVVFAPTFSFGKTNYAKGATGTKFIKQAMTGSFNDKMTLSTTKRNAVSGGGSIQVCRWDSASSTPTQCGTYSIQVTPDTHSIGIKHSLSTNTAKHISGSWPMRFRSVNDASQNISFGIEIERLPQ